MLCKGDNCNTSRALSFLLIIIIITTTIIVIIILIIFIIIIIIIINIGSLDTGSKFMVRGDSEPLALKKFENFREYLTLYPEYTCIFIGDNGQGDVRCAEMVLEDQRFSENMHRVYIHQVQPKHLTYCSTPKTTIRHPRVCYFTTYIDAAIDAFRNNLIRPSGLKKIMLEAINDFHYIPTADWTSGSTLVSMSGNQRLTSSSSSSSTSSNIEPFESRDFKQMTLQTVNASAKHINGIYSGFSSLKSTVVSNHDTRISSSSKQSVFIGVGKHNKVKTGALPGEELSSASMGYSRGGAMVKFINTSISQIHGERKRELRLRELNVDLVRGNVILNALGLETVPLLQYECRHHIGSVVNTLFGEGIITGFRSTDGIYEVVVGWNNDINNNSDNKAKKSHATNNINNNKESKIIKDEESCIKGVEIKNNSSCNQSIRGSSMVYKLFIAGVAIHC